MAWRDAIQGVSMKPSAGYLRDPWMTFWFGWLSAGIFSRFLNARGNLVLFLIAMLVLVLRGDLGKRESLSNQTPSVPTKPSFTEAELPSNVVWFERLMYLALGISLILTFLQWDYVVDVFVNDFGFPDPASAFVTMLFGLRTCWVAHLAGSAETKELGAVGAVHFDCHPTVRSLPMDRTEQISHPVGSGIADWSGRRARFRAFSDLHRECSCLVQGIR